MSFQVASMWQVRSEAQEVRSVSRLIFSVISCLVASTQTCRDDVAYTSLAWR